MKPPAASRNIALLVAMASSASWGGQEGHQMSTAASSPVATAEIQPSAVSLPAAISPLPVTIVESAADAEHARKREEKADLHDAADLNAQIRSASAAEEQVRINWSAFALSFIGALFLAWTLVETRRSAKAAVRVAELTRAEFISTHRPRIRVRQVLADPDLWRDGKVGVRCRIVNIGDTDARVVEFGIGHLVTKEARELHPEPRYEAPALSPIDLKSGEAHDFESFILPIEDKHLAGIRSFPSRYILFCFGYVKYLDSEGRARTTAFCRTLKLTGGPSTPDKFCRFASIDEEREEYEYED